MSQLFTVIGRGHGGTRAMSQTLADSGVFMGEPLNDSYDLVPAEAMYEACRVASRHVRHLGGLRWDFSALLASDPDPEFIALLGEYLRSVHDSPAERKGWKIPETTLVFPWIAKLFPDAYFINWIRDPRDSILGHHLTDDLARFGIVAPPPTGEDELTRTREQRAISWKYQVELIRATPKPARWISVRLEDFVLDQEATLARLEAFVGFPLARIPVKPEAVGRWKTAEGPHTFGFLADDLFEFGYTRESMCP